ncbi:MFS transporter [Aridibaculum aurantiacum]|uniref:MFS transporter n=1 Tax=Aridibaculum aurantiacum TaxID=2810307 RepID=UPI001A956563|nr:MFS transporter [Aridibaculum aurantiacum]
MDKSPGIKQNLPQFLLLLCVTAFVGGMVGMERSLLPKLATTEFGIESKTAIFSFIVAFGISKAISNYMAGRLSNQYGRRRLLIFGWLFALPVPWILMYAPNWNWIIFANVLLGINQGIAWSSTLVMKIDLAEDKNRGLAVGLNEFIGYLAVGLTTFLVAYIAANYGLRPYPFYTGVGFSILGILLSIFAIKDTRPFMQSAAALPGPLIPLNHVFKETIFFNRNLSSVVQGGLVNNLNDGMVWGLYPLILTAKGFSLTEIGVITAIYPACWGMGQLFSGKISDLIGRKPLLYWGMFLQAATLLMFLQANTYQHFVALSIVLGIGKAMVYPTFIAAIADNTHPVQRAETVGIYRFFRDCGYAIGAVLTGVISDLLGVPVAVTLVGVLTLLSGFVIKFRMTAK